MRETRDPQEVCAIALHPSVSEMFLGTTEEWQPRFGKGLVWLVGNEMLWFFHRHHGDWWEIHVAALPSARHTTKRQSDAAIRWFAENYGCTYLTGCVRTINEPGNRIAMAVGMKPVFSFPDHTVYGMSL